MPSFFSLHRIVFVAAITLCLALGLWHLPTSPKPWFDEGLTASIAKQVAETGIYGVQLTPDIVTRDLYWVTTQHPITLPVALMFRLFGVSVLGMRLVMVSYMLGLALIAHHLIKFLDTKKTALVSLWLVVAFSPLYGNGKAVLGETPGVFWILVATFLWLKGQRVKGRTWTWLVGAGSAFGLAAICKPSFLLLLPIVALAALIDIIQKRERAWKQAFLLGLPMAILVVLWFMSIVHPLHLEHAKEVFRFFSNSYQTDATSYVAVNVRRFFTESTPIHFLLFLTFIAVGYARIPRKRDVPAPLLAIGLFLITSFLWYLKTPGWYRYFYPAHLLALVFAPLALAKARIRWPNTVTLTRVMVVLVAVQLVVTFRNIDRFRSTSLQEFMDELSSHLPAQADVYVAHMPEVSLLLPSAHMSQTIYINPSLTVGENVLDPIQEPLPSFVITGLTEDVGVAAIEPTLKAHYQLKLQKNHYRMFEKYTQP